MYRTISSLLVVIALVGFILAAYLYWTEDAPGATVDDPDRKFPALTVGLNEARFRLHNPTRHNVRVVGYQFC
jgi:hypothetical protein